MNGEVCEISAAQVRRTSLDGLRGSAALVVFFFHLSLPLPIISAQTYTGTTWDLLLFTPLRVLLEGGEAVHLFFALSGYTLPFLLAKLKPYSWQYLVSRSVRLYIPAWIALALYIGASWLESSQRGVKANFGSPEKILRDFILVLGPSPGTDWILGVLWSLAFEIIFSLTMFLWLPIFKRGNPFTWLAVLVSLITFGDLVNSGLLQYLPMFFIGVVLSLNTSKFEALIQNLLSKISSFGLACTALVLVSSVYLVMPLIAGVMGDREPDFDVLKLYFYVPQFAGVCLLLGLALWDSALRRLLSSPLFAWLGRISFSLYLTHQIVLELIQPLAVPAVWIPIIATSVALATAQLYYYLIEKRVHLMARAIAAKP